MMMARWWFVVDKARRCIWTVIFMVAMVVSLLASSLPVMVAIGDVVVLSVLLSHFTCISCYGLKEHLGRYAFKSSLTDIPFVSIARSLIITCTYSTCNSPTLSHCPYLGTVTICSFVSILLLSIKACVYALNFQPEAEAASSLSRQKLHLKSSWGMPVLFLSSVAFALGHTVVAYRASCRARRKLLYHRVDTEAVLLCKNVFSGHQKAPRSPTLSTRKIQKSECANRPKPSGTGLNGCEVPLNLLEDPDSLFVMIEGLTIHYKLCLPGSPSLSLSFTSNLEPNMNFSTPEVAIGRRKLERQALSTVSEVHHCSLHRTYSNQFSRSSLYAPLLDDSANSLPPDHIPAFSLENANQERVNGLKFRSSEQDFERNGNHGIVLVHGFGGGVFAWRHVMEPLSRQLGCIVTGFDRPGWGLTSRPQRKEWEEIGLSNPYKLDSQVDLLLSFCSKMGFSSVVLVGHDDGGLLALKAAKRTQESRSPLKVAVKGVILLNASLSREVVPAFARILLNTSLGRKHMVRPLLRAEIAQVINRRAWYNGTKLTTEVLRLYQAPLCVEGWDEALDEISRLSSEMALSSQEELSLLRAVEDLPVLVVASAEDALVPLKSSQAMASKLVNSRLVAISGCGHLPHEECPKALLAAMAPFISRLLAEKDSQSR